MRLGLESMMWQTDIDVMPPDRVVERRDGYVVARSPSNPCHYFGNLLIFDEPPVAGDGERWERLFAAEFGGDPRIRHKTFGWDRTDGALGAADGEFVRRGYAVERDATLLAMAGKIVAHPRANRDVDVVPLDAAPGADARLWDEVIELQMASRDERAGDEALQRAFTRQRMDDRRALFRHGRGAWYVAVDPVAGAVAGSCGIVVTEGRGRFQMVDTAERHRRTGIASRLLVDAARHAASTYGAESFVICADASYHALPLYESLGFVRSETVSSVLRWPR
jgi:GNAT superfamily N-acetyltransferase